LYLNEKWWSDLHLTTTPLLRALFYDWWGSFLRHVYSLNNYTKQSKILFMVDALRTCKNFLFWDQCLGTGTVFL
jgi:hypothetical protein